MSTRNVETVKAIYAAFGKGDVPAILEALSEDVDWDHGYEGSPIPWLQHRRGREGAGAFFAALGALDFHRFVPSAILGEGDLVVAICALSFTVKATGKRVDDDVEAHVWAFDARGKVARFRHCADTLQHARALGI